MCREAQPDGREASVPSSLTCAHGVSVTGVHHLASFSKEPLHLPPLYSHYYIGKSKTAFNITVPKGPLSIRMPSQNRAYLCSAGLKAPKGNKRQPIWEPGMKKRGKEMEEQLPYFPPLGTSERNMQGGWPRSSSIFRHCFALLWRIRYTLITDWSQVAINASLALGSRLLGLTWAKSALGAWGAHMLLQWHGERAGGKRSSPATTQGQRHCLKLSPFTPTQVSQAIKHKKDLGFSKPATSSRFHAWESHNLPIQALWQTSGW